MHEYGPDIYDDWFKQIITSQNNEITLSILDIGKLIFDENTVYGGNQRIVSKEFRNNYRNLLDENNSCVFSWSGHFASMYFPPDKSYGDDFDFFKFPSKSNKNAMVGIGDSLVILNTSNKSLDVFRALVDGNFGQIWISKSDSTFIGYDSLKSDSKIIEYSKNKEGEIYLVLDQTPFYAESGGQVADMGKITGENITLDVIDVKNMNQSIVHICKGAFDYSNPNVHCTVEETRRNKTRNNHTATHLMHKALKNILGDHVNQAGSLVHPDYLRFDLTHFEKITKNQIAEVEKMVTDQILENKKLEVSIKSFDDAKSQGAEALFGEKYGEEVRVVKVGDYSMELCGGTHVNRTGDIGMFKITEESSLASGVRRIIALTGTHALEEIQRNHYVLDTLQKKLNVSFSEIINRVNTLIDDKKELEKKVRKRSFTNFKHEIFSDAEKIGDIEFILKKVNVDNMDELKSLGDQIFKKLPNGIAVLFSEGEGKPMALIVVAKKLNESGILAGDLAKKIGMFMAGGGGGKPHMATAGGKDNSVLDLAMSETKDLIAKIIKAV